MSIVHMMNEITEWIQKNICNGVKLKLPDDGRNDAGYNSGYELVTPAAWPMYMPTKDRLPPNAPAPIPSICVQMLDGEDGVIDGRGNMNLRLMFSAWDPGLHGQDIFTPVKDDAMAFQQWNTEEAMAFYQRRNDGWQDAWNFVDTARRVLINNNYIAGYRIAKEEGLKYGVPQEQDAVADYYPYWFAWLTVSIQYGVTSTNADLQEFI